MNIGSEIVKIVILSTGGTIEKSYDEAAGSLENRDAQLHRILGRLRLPHTEIHLHGIMNKDSLELTDSDRQLICSEIKRWQSLGYPIVVIHGTDTMANTARYCEEHIKELAVPVVFTGAMKPLGFEDSDAQQNVTEALAVAKLMTAGFYISFHNRVFEASLAEKDREKNTFNCTTTGRT